MLQEHRLKKIASELEISEKKNDLQGMLNHIQMLEETLSNIVSAHTEESSILDEIENRLTSTKNNTSIVIKILQGKDECEKEPVVTDYTNSQLIPRTQIEELNSQIVELNKQPAEKGIKYNPEGSNVTTTTNLANLSTKERAAFYINNK